MKKYFKFFIISFITSILTIPLRGGYVSIFTLEGFPLSGIIAFSISYILTYCFFLKYSSTLNIYYILLAVLLGGTFYEWPYRIINFELTLISLPEALIRIFGIALAFIVFKTQLYIKYLFVVLGFIFTFLFMTIGYDLWLNKLNFGTFSGRIENITDVQLEFQSIEEDTLSLSDFKGKYLILDCWYTHCGICYKEMPKVQELYNKYKNDTQVQIFALHSRMEDENFSTGARILGEREYTLPCLSVDIDNPSLKELGVKGYPTVLLFNRESKLIFRGNIDFAEKYLEKVLNDLNEI